MALVALAVLSLRPAGFAGGGADDQRYFDAALAWLEQQRFVGTTHWDLRWPLIAPLAGLFALFGPSTEIALLLPWAAALLVVVMTFACVQSMRGARAAWLAASILVTLPLFARAGTSLFPEILELLFAAGALWALCFGRLSARPARWFLASGTCAALAVLTRETSAWLLLVYGAAFLFAPGARRPLYAWIAAPLAIAWGAELLTLLWLTGDPFYRIRVDLAHVTIPSASMQGGTHDGAVLFNPALAERWRPAGVADVHWALNPLLNLFANPGYGLLAWATAALGVMAARLRALGHGDAGFLAGCATAAIAAFAFVTYVLMTSQDQRYYLPVVYLGAVAAGLLAERLLRRGKRLPALAVCAVLIASNLLLTAHGKSFDDRARALIPLVRLAPAPVHAHPDLILMLRQRLREEGLEARVADGPPGEGALILELQVRRSCEDALPPATIACRDTDPPPLVALSGRLGVEPALPARLVRPVDRAILYRRPKS